ncbi:outer membrane lipoprotein-sorting protein [Oceanithermus sp.]
MGLKQILLRLTALLALSSVALAQQPDPRALLHRAIDQLRGPAMAATYTLLVERPGRNKKYVLRVYTDGGDRAHIRVIEPKRDAGQAFLTIGQDIWIYNPRLGRVLRLPPSGRNDRFLGSDVSYADLSGRDLESDYRVSLAEAETGADTLTLVLTPNPTAPVPWGRVEMVLGKKDLLLRKIVYYDQRGAAVKDFVVNSTAALPGGGYLITGMLVRDLVRPGYRTVFEVSDWKTGSPPESCFSPAALERGCRF